MENLLFKIHIPFCFFHVKVSSKICHLGLRLALLCLTFDFVGTSPSESTEDSGLVI